MLILLKTAAQRGSKFYKFKNLSQVLYNSLNH